jgi:hypothetical protein
LNPGDKSENKTEKIELYNARTSPKITRNVLKGIDPKRLNPNARFHKAVYLAEKGETSVSEVEYHGGKASHTIRYHLNVAKSKILDLTQETISKEWGYRGGNNYSHTQEIAHKAKKMGYNVIKYNSLRGPGSNYAVMNDFEEILEAQGVAPVQ